MIKNESGFLIAVGQLYMNPSDRQILAISADKYFFSPQISAQESSTC